MYVSDGFWHADEVIAAPSITNRFGTSHAWLCAFSTDVAGSRPMRAVPISWMVRPCGDVGAGTIEDGLNEPANHAAIIGAFEEHIPLAAREGVPNVICFFGNRRGMADGPAIENSIRCLRECAPIAESEGVTILVEVLNSKPGGHVDYMGDHMSYALEVMRAVDSPRVRILYDIYHMQTMEGDIIRTLTGARDWIGHYHTGGVPGRAEIDGTQELHYPAIVRAIRDTGFTGYMAHEFIPRSGDPLRSLAEAVDLCARA